MWHCDGCAHLPGHDRHEGGLPRDAQRHVTAEWAKHHHELWYNDIKAGKIPESPMVSETVVPEPVRRAVLLGIK
jgi:hypothetical protein